MSRAIPNVETVETVNAAGERASSSLGLGAHPTVLIASVCVVSIGLMTALAGQPAFGFGTLAVGVVLLAFHLAARRDVKRCAARDRAWIGALPFVLENHFLMLARGSAFVEIAFREHAPAHAEWETFLAGLRGDPVFNVSYAELGGGRYEVQVGRTRAGIGARETREGWRRVVEDLLLKVHAHHAIDTARVRA